MLGGLREPLPSELKFDRLSNGLIEGPVGRFGALDIYPLVCLQLSEIDTSRVVVADGLSHGAERKAQGNE